MAELVQEALDAMVAPLRDLMDRNIFSEEEIKAIVRRRRESEYLLRRPTARKADFLRYIEAEQQLEKLRRLRYERRKREEKQRRYELGLDDDEDQTQKKKSIGDAHITNLIHLLFIRVIRKFRSDLSLHLLHAEFCKDQKSFGRLGKVYAGALQIFPRQAGLWIEAASHEFFGPTRSIRNARVLMQRGLRFNKTNEDLWVEYFALELHYAQTLRGRKQILQGKDGMDSEEYMLASIVVKNAFLAIPDSVAFRLRFLDVCQRFPLTEDIMEFIHESIKNDFVAKPEAWIARAMYESAKSSGALERSRIEQRGDEAAKDDSDESSTGGTSKRQRISNTEDKVIEVLQEAIESLPTDEMFVQALRYARSHDDQRHVSNGRKQSATQKFIETILAKTSNDESFDLVEEKVDYLLSIGDRERALHEIETCCRGSGSRNSDMWLLWTKVAPQENSPEILRQAIECVPISDKSNHVKLLVRLLCSLADSDGDLKEADDLFQRLQLLSAGYSHEDERAASVVDAYIPYLRLVTKHRGVRGARTVYNAALLHTEPAVDEYNLDTIRMFVDECLELEDKQDPVDKRILRRLYDKAIALFSDTELENEYRDRRNDHAIYR